MKLLTGIIIGILLALSVKTVYAAYEYHRLSIADQLWVGGAGFYVIWDEAEKTNCYVRSQGGVSCVRSMNY